MFSCESGQFWKITVLRINCNLDLASIWNSSHRARLAVKLQLTALLIGSVVFLSACASSYENAAVEPAHQADHSAPRFTKLDAAGIPLANQSVAYTEQQWHCIQDRLTRLIWEVKSTRPGLQFNRNRYRWESEQQSENNRALSGQLDCRDGNCDTATFIQSLRQQALCAQTQWRLPEREELRSLLNYAIPFPGPSLEQHVFPNALAQFYWSATPDAGDKDSAWGLGFSFGYDYTYLQQHAGYVRAVAQSSGKGTTPDRRCESNVSEAVDSQRLKISGDNQVLDRRNLLIWQRCAFGQSWHEGTCRGSATALSLHEAQLIGERQRQRSGLPWRLPRLAELSGLANLNCHDPAIDSRAFPNTASSPFWTNTAFVNREHHYWQVHFLDGGNMTGLRQSRAFVRLVREP